MTVSWLSELASFALPIALGAAATVVYYRWDDLWPRIDAWIGSPQPPPTSVPQQTDIRLVAGRPYDWAQPSGAGSGERRGIAPVGKVSRLAPEEVSS